MTYIGRGRSSGDAPIWDGVSWVSNSPLPEGGNTNQALGKIRGASDIIGPQRVTTITGTDLWVAGAATVGDSNIGPRSVITSLNGGQTWVTHEDPVAAPFVPAFVIHDELTGRSFIVSEDPDTATGSHPTDVRLEEITSLDPFTMSGSPLLFNNVASTDTLESVSGITAPGNGRIYVAGNMGGSVLLLEYDIDTNDTLQEYTFSGAPPDQIEVDLDVSKYGDGFGRVYWSSRNGGFGRVSLQDLSVTEEATQLPAGAAPGGGGGWGNLVAGLTLDTANNAGWGVLRNNNNGQPWLVRYQLEPFLTVDYSASISTNTSYYPSSCVYDPTTARVVVLYQHQNENYPATAQNFSYVGIFQDTGAALTLLQTHLIPEGHGAAARTTIPTYNPELSVINGTIYIPLNGGVGGVEYADSLMNTVLALDPLDTDFLYDALSVTSWRSFDLGDLYWRGVDESGLAVSHIRGLEVRAEEDLSNVRVGEGGVLRAFPNFVEGTLEYERVYSQHYWELTQVGGNFSTGLAEDGVKLNVTGTHQVRLNIKPDPPTTHGAFGYSVHDIAGTLSGANTSTVNSLLGDLFYGLNGTTTGETDYRIHSRFENVNFSWSQELERWVMTSRWRPWDNRSYSAGATETLTGGQTIVTMNTGTGSGLSTLTLPFPVNHGDEVIITDADGLADQNNIRITGDTVNINDLTAGSEYITINQSRGHVHVMFDAVANRWVIVAQSGTDQTAPAINQTVYTNADTGSTLPDTGGAHVIYQVDTTGGPVSLNEPATRVTGMRITLVDVGGDAGANNITFSGTGVVGTSTISSNNGSRTWQWDAGGSQWLPTASA